MAMRCAGAIDHWKALTQWSVERLVGRLGDTEVAVAVTPNGRADAVTTLLDNSGGDSKLQCFCLPLEERMPFAEVAAHISSHRGQSPVIGDQRRGPLTGGLAATHTKTAPRDGGTSKGGSSGFCSGRGAGKGEVWYIQHQNNSLVTEFPALLSDVESHLPWATGEIMNSLLFGPTR